MKIELTEQQLQIVKRKIEHHEKLVGRVAVNRAAYIFIVVFLMAIAFLFNYLGQTWDEQAENLLREEYTPQSFEEVQSLIYKFATFKEKMVETKFLMVWHMIILLIVVVAGVRYWKICKLDPVEILFYKAIIAEHESKETENGITSA